MNNEIAKIQNYFKKLNCLATSTPPLLQIKSKIRLNARILRLNFLSDLARGPFTLIGPLTATSTS